jgi:hypothetical protein
VAKKLKKPEPMTSWDLEYTGVKFQVRRLFTGYFHNFGSYGGPYRSKRLAVSDAAERIDLANG